MCQIEFYFNNKLHRHVRFCQKKKRKNVVEIVTKINYETIENIFIVDFIVIIISNEKYNFRRWHYVTMLINHFSNDEFKKICDDSNCTMFLIDRQHLLIARSKIEIKKTTNFIKIHDIDKTFHDNSKYVELDFYIFEKTSNDIEIIVHFKREMHVINDFRVNVFLKTNILNSKSIIINMSRKFIIFFACENIFVFLNIISKKTRITRFVKSTI